MRPLHSCIRTGLLIWLLWWLPTAAAHTPPAMQRAVLEDVEGQLTVSALSGAEFVAVDGVLSRGFSASTRAVSSAKA